MKKIVLDIQSDIHAQTMERMLMQKLAVPNTQFHYYKRDLRIA